jgi:hypothetical protein
MAKFPIQIDATNPDLVFNRFRIPGVDDDPNVPHQAFDHDATVVNTIDLESGADIFIQIQSGIAFPPWSFRVTAAGMVDYNPSFDNFLSGRGTTKLTINGFEVTLDARRLGTGGVVMLNIAEKFGFINFRKVRMTPQFGLHTGYGVLQASGVVGNFEFGLGLGGLFEYDRALDISSRSGFLAGQRTTTLEFYGFPVALDGRAADPPGIILDSLGAVPGFRVIEAVALLPGAGYQQRFTVGGVAKFTTLEVKLDGSVTVSDDCLLAIDSIPSVRVRGIER